MKPVLLGLALLLFFTEVCSAQTTLYFPQFVDGSQTLQVGGTEWGTTMLVTNPAASGTPTASGTVTLTNSNGTPMNLTLLDSVTGIAGNTFQIAGGQTKFFASPNLVTTSPMPFNVGFATVTSNIPVAGASAFIEFIRSLPNGTIAVGGIPAATPLTRQAIVAVFNTGDPIHNVPTNNTGIAIANPGSSTTTITFQLVDSSGASIQPQVTQTLAANNQAAFYFSNLFPSIPSPTTGMLRITSNNPIVLTALFFQGNAFGTIPSIPLQ